MKATGIVRRIDDLGRVVIPKEIRRTLRIKEGTPLEIFTDREGEIILKKYSPIGELSIFARIRRIPFPVHRHAFLHYRPRPGSGCCRTGKQRIYRENDQPPVRRRDQRQGIQMPEHQRPGQNPRSGRTA